MKPNFVCVGPGRSGTSWLYEVLLAHPDVCLAKNIKETKFFDKYYDKGWPWYERFFRGCNARAVGEITNSYIFDPAVPARIKEALPDCKIIICLRNPYERIVSNYSYKIREGHLNCSFEEALRVMPTLVEEVKYYTLIKPYIDMFERSRIFFMFFDDLKENPEQLLSDLYGFLGIGYYIPEIVKSRRKVNRAIVPRAFFVASLAKKTAIALRAVGLHKVLSAAKRSDSLKAIFFKPYEVDAEAVMTPGVRKVVMEAVGPELERLSPIVGRDLAMWKP